MNCKHSFNVLNEKVNWFNLSIRINLYKSQHHSCVYVTNVQETENKLILDPLQNINEETSLR